MNQRPGAYNILFILTDQERQFRAGELPADFSLPAHERLRRQGTTFVNQLVLAMNDKLNNLIESEVGEDRGQMLPGGIEAGWEVTPETMAP